MARGFGKFLLANNTTQSVWKPQDIPKQINDDTPTHPQHQSNLLGFNSLLQIDSRHLQQQTMVFLAMKYIWVSCALGALALCLQGTARSTRPCGCHGVLMSQRDLLWWVTQSIKMRAENVNVDCWPILKCHHQKKIICQRCWVSPTISRGIQYSPTEIMQELANESRRWGFSQSRTCIDCPHRPWSDFGSSVCAPLYWPFHVPRVSHQVWFFIIEWLEQI